LTKGSCWTLDSKYSGNWKLETGMVSFEKSTQAIDGGHEKVAKTK
jgi:hypothetical protein